MNGGNEGGVHPAAPRCRRTLPLWVLLVPLFAGGCQSMWHYAALLPVGIWGVSLASRRLRALRALPQPRPRQPALPPATRREMEHTLRREIALAVAGHGVSPDREWASRLALGTLLTAESRLDEAREVLLADNRRVSDDVRHQINFCILQINVLAHEPDQATLDAIRRGRQLATSGVTTNRALVSQSASAQPSEPVTPTHDRWTALEGLCLARMGRHDEAIDKLKNCVVGDPDWSAPTPYFYYLGQAYELAGHQTEALTSYLRASQSLPGSKYADMARHHHHALQTGGAGGPFRSADGVGEAG
ncbi:MAG: tetratricopeptide repeat protein [Myxococcales bacterium FL481]|nr:MAG: tetratricopeptide repeat protein [Myxococcales bacterium FL481]